MTASILPITNKDIREPIFLPKPNFTIIDKNIEKEGKTNYPPSPKVIYSTDSDRRQNSDKKDNEDYIGEPPTPPQDGNTPNNTAQTIETRPQSLFQSSADIIPSSIDKVITGAGIGSIAGFLIGATIGLTNEITSNDNKNQENFAAVTFSGLLAGAAIGAGIALYFPNLQCGEHATRIRAQRHEQILASRGIVR
jgi:hypothetical protein